MLLVFHITSALSGILLSAYAFLSPSKTKLDLSYGLTITTIVSGTVLVVKTHSSLVGACIAGLTYTGAVLYMLILARKKLEARSPVANNSDK